MRIALFHDLPSGGAKRVIEAQARGLRSIGHEVVAHLPSTADETFLPLKHVVDEVVVHDRPQPPDRARLLTSRAGAVVEPARWISYMGHVRSTDVEIARRIDGGGYDVVLVHPSQFTQAPYLLRYLGTPTLYYCHEPLRAAHEPWFAPAWLRLALRHTLGRVDHRNAVAATSIAANSRFMSARIETIYARTAAVAYPGIDHERFRPLGVPRGSFVLTVGALHRAKGLDFVLDVMASTGPGEMLPLVVVSDRRREEERRYIRARADRLGVPLTLMHRVDDDELVRLYNEAAAVVYAPHDEPLGLVPLEAMACEAPVLGVAEGGVPETIEDGVTGLLAPRDTATFARRLRVLLDQPERAAALGKQGRRRVLEKWGWSRAIDDLDRLCHEASRSGRSALAPEGT